MLAPRRFLPSVASLLALEAVARLGTATQAADELALTHSAVSRQLKVLEEQIGVPLFRREGKALILTPAGQDYVETIRDYLQDLARASLRLRAAGQGRAITLAVLPAFGTHWLLPRLRGFAEAHPGITVNLSTRLAPFDFGRERFDAAIHYGGRDWQGVEYQELAREEIMPVASPDLIRGREALFAAEPGRLRDLPLLHLESRPGAWEDWFARRGLAPGTLPGMLFDQFSHLAEAAALGLGVALLPRFMTESEFHQARLMRLATDCEPLEGSYSLVWPSFRPASRALEKLSSWLAARA
jgi:DNA-binding transcriptional LysR family regulator